jgi:hypothetical protein
MLLVVLRHHLFLYLTSCFFRVSNVYDPQSYLGASFGWHIIRVMCLSIGVDAVAGCGARNVPITYVISAAVNFSSSAFVIGSFVWR